MTPHNPKPSGVAAQIAERSADVPAVLIVQQVGETAGECATRLIELLEELDNDPIISKAIEQLQEVDDALSMLGLESRHALPSLLPVPEAVPQDFPLSRHSNGSFFAVRRVAGRKRWFYFGADWRTALAAYEKWRAIVLPRIHKRQQRDRLARKVVKHRRMVSQALASDWAPAFLETFALTGCLKTSCEVAGVSHQAVYKRRRTDDEFQRQWKAERERAERRTKGGVMSFSQPERTQRS